MHRVLLLSTFLELVLSQLFSPAVDVKTLSELPLERLLQVRNNFALKRKDFALLGENSASPQALPLQSKTTNNRGGYGVHQDDTKGGKKGIQSIFQISVTTLAFLAFGGYLLCLIVQAIKGKQNYMMDNGQQVGSSLTSKLKLSHFWLSLLDDVVHSEQACEKETNKKEEACKEKKNYEKTDEKQENKNDKEAEI